MKEMKHVFSMITGETYTVEADEVQNLDITNQIVLKKPFPKSCKKCYGRGYIGNRCKNVDGSYQSTNELFYCLTCLKKCVDQ